MKERREERRTMPVIVIDPGHGGENLGGEYGNFTEKTITPIVANAMKEQLEKYEDVTVYLTHEEDVDMSLKERADFAKSVNADFLFCLHFNLSVHHNLFGAEVWVPSTGELYSKGYAFAEIQMKEMTDLGIYSRGIKTKLNDRGTDYYGILRECTADGVPAALIEHCHLDHAKDAFAVANGEESFKELGRRDAEAVAKYFKLHSTELGVDYSDYQVSEIPIPSQAVRPDESEPEVNEIELVSLDTELGRATVRMKAVDSDGYIQYYMYSLDGGNTYTELKEWPRPEVWNRSVDTIEFECELPFDRQIEIKTTAYNGFDKTTESNGIVIDAIEDPERLKLEEEERLRKEQEKEQLQEQQQEQQQQEQEEKPQTYQDVDYQEVIAQTEVKADYEPRTSAGIVAISVSGILLVMIFLLFILAKSLKRLKRHNKRH